MKTMTCMQLGGACEQKFTAASFEEIAELSKQHGTAMFQQGDAAHLKAMEQMRELMQEPAQMKGWFDARRDEFDSLPEDSG